MVEEIIGVYPGTFDPVTYGHLNIIKRATKIVDKLIVGVAVNTGKNPLFPLEKRIELLKEEIAELPEEMQKKIEVKPIERLLVEFASEVGASLIIRGLRAVSDFDYEFKMSVMNARLNKKIETVFLMASEKNQFVSSMFVKEIIRLGGDISSFVSPRVNKVLFDEYNKLGKVGSIEC